MGLTEDALQRALTEEGRGELPPSERAALDYAEQITRDESSIDDGVYDELREHYDEGEIVELGVFIALCNGFDKLISTWRLSPTVCDV